MSYPKVTVLIPNYNGKKWLKQLLPTLKKSTYPNKEILIVNNGSTDDSARFLKENGCESCPEFRANNNKERSVG